MVGGRGLRAPYGAAHALGQWAASHWEEFDGACVLQGIDPFAFTARRLLNLIYATLIRNASPEQRSEIDSTLERAAAMVEVAPAPAMPTKRKPKIRIPTEAEMYASSVAVSKWVAQDA